MEKLFSLMQSHLLILAFVAFTFGVNTKQIIAKANVGKLTPLIYSSFMVSILAFAVL